MSEAYLYIAYLKNMPGVESVVLGEDGKPIEKSVAICRFDTETGKTTILRNSLQKDFTGIGHACIDTKRDIYYATDEREDLPGLRGGGGGMVRSYRIDPATGELNFINAQPAFGSKTADLCQDAHGKYLLVVNHGSRSNTTVTEQDAYGNYHIKVQHDEANVVLFPLAEDGSIAPPKDIFRLCGSGPKSFQQSSHAHSVNQVPGKNVYIVCDKGGDQVYTFSIDYDREKLVPCPGSPFHRMPGSAPRYSAAHPILPYIYVNKEMETRLSVFRCEDNGGLEEVQVIDKTVPDGLKVPGPKDWGQSDILVSPDGHCCYLFIRVSDIVNVYDIDQETGCLKLKQTVPTRGGVQMASLSPDGRFLAVSYPSNNLVEILPVAEDGTLGDPVDSVVRNRPGGLNFYVV